MQTRIFQVSPFKYAIVFDAAILGADQIRGEFANSIQPAALSIELSNDIPTNFLREIATIADHQIASGFAGLPFNRDDLRTVLYGKFPSLPSLVRVEDVESPSITLCFERELLDDEKRSVAAFFEQWEAGWPIEFAVASSTGETAAPDSPFGRDMLRIKPVRTRTALPRFVQEDEAYWFDHVDALFEGSLNPNRVIDVERLGTTCYVDASSFPQIDLRQTILCYDTVLMSPPLIGDGEESFWRRQSLSRDDFVELAGADRVRFVLRQPEERTDVAFLHAVYQANPSAIIGRRKASALLAADLVQTADEYRFNGVADHVPELARQMAQELHLSELEIIQLLLWPSSARRSCLLPLMTSGLMSIGAFGQGRLLGDQIQRATGQDLRLEAFVASDDVHIAHAFNATLIPPLEEKSGIIMLRRLVGDRLNFYRACNTRIFAAWATNERRREEKIRLLPSMPIFDFPPHAKLRDLISLTSYQSTRRKGRALLSRLSQLPFEERESEIERLSKDLYELGVRREKRAMLLDTADDVKEVAGALIDLTLFPVRSVWNLVNKIVAVGRRIPALDNFIDDLERDTLPQRFRNTDLDFLSKIERVAVLREPVRPASD
ncbi:hypothetical protein CQ12_06090 [Bradyrhizobium jicamae]|uniref:Uncharacterized protein n=1 Tax=Bradyrhizobium jicamae TaxID=280332 RepID=A0A0R3LQ42_9BRAD|nr:hypothetical protein CQ12_06090 [Bradyrhizobium jicamae]